jgi:TonB family protein
MTLPSRIRFQARSSRAVAIALLVSLALSAGAQQGDVAEAGDSEDEATLPLPGPAETPAVSDAADEPAGESEAVGPVEAARPAPPQAAKAPPEIPDEDVGPPANFTGPTVDEESATAPGAGPDDEFVEPRIAAYRRMVDLMEQRRYEEAIRAAQQALTLSEQEFGSDNIRLVAAMNNLATAHMMNGDLDSAEATYKRSLALTQRREGILSKRLINIYIGLGATYNRAGLYEQAAEAFQRALRINHVNDGFYNFDQFKIRDGLTEANIGMEELEEANFHQEIQVEINKRKLGTDNPDIAPAMYKLGRWYERSGQLELARLIYQDARRLLYNAYGKNDVVLVDALVGISSTYDSQGLVAESANALKRALQLLEQQEQPDYLRSAELLVKLGDLYNRYGKRNSAASNYERAWQELSVDEEFESQRDDYFSEPQRIGGLAFRTLRFGPGVVEDSDLLRDGYVLLSFAVDDTGRVEDARVIESEPPELMDDKVKRVLERSLFRPRMSDGLTVDTYGLMYRHEFRYLPQQEPDDDERDRGDLDYPGGRLERPGETASAR